MEHAVIKIQATVHHIRVL